MIHFTARKLAAKTQNLSLFILPVIGTAITVLVGLIGGEGLAHDQWRHKRNMK